MTRKARRKKLQEQAKYFHRTPSPDHAHLPWLTVGAIVASTTLAFRATPVLAKERDSVAPHRVSTLYAQNQSAQTSSARAFAIPPGPLDTVLAAFERATGVQFTVAVDAIRAIYSPGVSGTFTIEQALAQLLVGTSVNVRWTGPASATLELRIGAEAVDVTGVAPGTGTRAPQYAAPLRDIPQTIQVIPRQAMEAQGVTTLSEALRNVPGITLQAGEGGGASNTAGDMFNMRGFKRRNSLFVDGVRDDGLVSRDVFNLEQVEVFMGPTGSDVGRGTAAGYVNMADQDAASAAARARRPCASGPPISAGGTRPQPGGSLRRSRYVDRESAVRLNALLAGQRRPRPRRGAS